MPPKKSKAKTQKQLNVEQYTLLKKPLDHLGKQLNVEGSFWKGNMSAEERETVYKCTILVKVGFNKKAYTPSVAAVKDKYYEMFRGKKGADEDEAAWAAGTSAEAVRARVCTACEYLLVLMNTHV